MLTFGAATWAVSAGVDTMPPLDGPCEVCGGGKSVPARDSGATSTYGGFGLLDAVNGES